ncbi:conserved hypothetical protein [Aliivibrio fischeri MJ11]|uniref:Uncharacterized protein n=1 Tax=Aliivibrio fischeri (strain MJ11) TaxID=388396 RepID=B5EU82_ALIFM|nr:hypothetical protein [Aliivibrio fischeri]ACH63558.1 conserved hypothetical protein [Aliivibrio fischeri MJ11]
MADIATISAIITSVKTATDLAKLIKNSEFNLEAAEFKLNMAELISNLADVKIEAAELQEELLSRDKIIKELKKQLTQKNNLRFDGVYYWLEGDKTPFCTRCMEENQSQIHLYYLQEGMVENTYVSEQWRCRVCDSSYFI